MPILNRKLYELTDITPEMLGHSDVPLKEDDFSSESPKVKVTSESESEIKSDSDFEYEPDSDIASEYDSEYESKSETESETEANDKAEQWPQKHFQLLDSVCRSMTTGEIIYNN